MTRLLTVAATILLVAAIAGFWSSLTPETGRTPTDTVATTTAEKTNTPEATTTTTAQLPSTETPTACFKVFPPGPLMVETPYRYKAPGEKVEVYIRQYRAWDCLFNGTIRVEVHAYRGMDKALVHSGNFTLNDLPIHVAWSIPGEGYPERYKLTVSAIDDGSVVDLFQWVLFVAEPPRLNATLTTDKDAYRAGETLRLIIVNYGEEPILVGRPYTVYRLVNDTWVLCRRLTPSAWTAEAYLVPGGLNFTLTISLEGAEPGVYKIVKKVYGYRDPVGMLLETRFVVEP